MGDLIAKSQGRALIMLSNACQKDALKEKGKKTNRNN